MLVEPVLSFLRFGIVLSLLVFVHELGHFLAAKWRGVFVEEFGFGLPPRIWGKRVGDTLYSINLFPIGGFVKLKGEDPEVVGFGDADSFAVKSRWSRALIIIAGVLGNFLLAWLIFTFLFAVGNPEFRGDVFIKDVAPNSPAAQVGIRKGDQVISINGVAVRQLEDLIVETRKSAGTEVKLQLRRGGDNRTLRLIPRLTPPKGEGAMGVALETRNERVDVSRYPLWQSPLVAAKEVVSILGKMLSGVKILLMELIFRGEVPKEVTGIVGIKALTDVAAEMGERFFLQFVAILSLNLLIFNLLPIPALDGGRLLFVGIEAITGRKLPPRVERWANNLGLALMLLLFVLITIRDIGRFY
jgi:regulator of sigma E protease